jgi:polysaccharide deacetylase 2 family uncharacterized protein YibQ
MPKSTPRKTSRKPVAKPATRSSTKPKTSRKRKSPQKNPPKKKNRLGQSILLLIVAMGLVMLGYWVGHFGTEEEAVERPTPSHVTSHSANATPKPKLPTAMEILQYGFDEDAQGEEEMPEISWYVPGSGEIASSPSPSAPSKKTPPSSTSVVPVSSGGKPRLAIIIDDISHPRQLKTLQRLPYHITPSIFPPSELSASSHKLARGLKHCMVHLPLQSGSKAMNKMQGMLFVKDSTSKVQARVKEIRRLFPHAKYINNHTGSVFTSDKKAMTQLYAMLRKQGFVFVDSRTTAKSVVRAIARSYDDPYIARDVFIDNTQKVSVILAQLKKAVALAKKRGYAIAIGHPHKATMEALRRAKTILKGVETVYIDALYR